MSTEQKDNTRLFISGLFEGATEEDIRPHFEPFGSITDIYILRNKKNKSRGCCFIGFLNKSQASNALKLCNRTYLGTRRINVKFAFNKQQQQQQRQQQQNNNSSKSKHNHTIAASSNSQSSQAIEAPKNKEFEQFVRLSKSTGNIAVSEDVLHSFLDDSDSENSDDSINDLDELQKKRREQLDVKEVEEHNKQVTDAVDHKDGKQSILSDHKVTEIFIRNLPFITAEEDLYEFFSAFGNISQVFIPLDDFGKAKGYAFVQFVSNECIQTLFEKYRNTLENDTISVTFNGRNVDILLSNYKYKETHYINGKELCYDDLDDELKSNLTFKELRDLKLKHNAKNDVSWNTLFIPTDNILRYNAQQLNVTKSQLLGVNTDTLANSMAITTTLAETSVISKTKAFLSENGIDLDKFNGAKKGTIRSRNTILVKNFPFNTGKKELLGYFTKYGEVARFLLPDTKACAIVEFLQVKDAQNAFHNLAYAKFKHAPLFLEWAPINLFGGKKIESMQEQSMKEQSMKEQEEKLKITDSGKRRKKRKLSELEDENKTKVIVKNIPFETTKKELTKLFEVYGKLKSLRLPKKYGGGHRGFCFIEFDTNKEALNTFDALSSSHFYGRHLVIEWAKNDNPNLKKTRIE